MKNKDRLPLFGVGPFCVYLMVLLLAGGIVLHFTGVAKSGYFPVLRIPFYILGALLTAFGVYLWCKAVFASEIDNNIKKNTLVTDGVYAWVRNPVYSGIAFALTGISLFFCNLWFLILPFLFWLDITLSVVLTEEKWLLNLYGEKYSEYCKKVNRCIPNPFKK